MSRLIDELSSDESVVRTIRQPSLVVSADGTVEAANAAFYRTFFLSPDETVGRPLRTLPGRHWDIPALRDLIGIARRSDDPVEDRRIEHDFGPVGHRVLLFNACRLPIGGERARVLLVIEDATEREQGLRKLPPSDERLGKLFDVDAVGVLFFDRDGTLLDANRAFLRMSGYTREDLGSRVLTWRSLTSPEWVGVSEEQMAHLEATGQIGPYEKELLRKDGSRLWMMFGGRRVDDGTIIEYCLDINERKRTETERELLARELNHRVKNIFAVVQALASQSSANTDSVAAFRDAFLGRLHALAETHNLLLNAEWRGADLGALVRNELEPYRLDHPEGVKIEGEPVPLTPAQSLGLSLVFHELGTNAAKYGALSRTRGRLRVAWRIEQQAESEMLRLRWEERGGPPAATPERKGFGSRLITQACTYQLGGSVELSYAPEGLTCEITFPVER